MIRLAILASGTGSNMDSILRKSAEGLLDARVTLVVSDKPGAPCLDKAQAAGVAATLELPPLAGERREAYDARLRDAVATDAPDLIVLAGFMRILTPTFVDAFAGRIINIHPALLPSFKGAHGIRDTLRAGARLAGCTTHFVTADLDGGPIILQAALPVRERETEPELAARVLAMEHMLLPRTIQLFAEGRLRIEAGQVRVADGPSWHTRLPPVAGAVYPEAY